MLFYVRIYIAVFILLFCASNKCSKKENISFKELLENYNEADKHINAINKFKEVIKNSSKLATKIFKGTEENDDSIYNVLKLYGEVSKFTESNTKENACTFIKNHNKKKTPKKTSVISTKKKENIISKEKLENMISDVKKNTLERIEEIHKKQIYIRSLENSMEEDLCRDFGNDSTTEEKEGIKQNSYNYKNFLAAHLLKLVEIITMIKETQNCLDLRNVEKVIERYIEIDNRVLEYQSKRISELKLLYVEYLKKSVESSKEN